MKKILFLFSVIFTILLFTGCSDSENSFLGWLFNPEYIGDTTEPDTTEVAVVGDIQSGWHNNIICTKFSIYKEEDPLSGGTSAWGETEMYNAYYFALPYNNRTYKYYRDNKGFVNNTSFTDAKLSEEVKNRWIEIVNLANNKTAFAQWEDVGPWFFEDVEYVFSDTPEVRPRAEANIGNTIDRGYMYSQQDGVRTATVSDYNCNGAGLDISPTAMKYLTDSDSVGKIKVRWRFVTDAEANAADLNNELWYKSVNTNKAPQKVINNLENIEHVTRGSN